ncbi:MAG: glycosyltransferase, partial [Planctomycetota bacterium]
MTFGSVPPEDETSVGRATYKNDEATSSFTVVVPTLNGGDALLAVLDAIVGSERVPSAVIVADDGSTDGSPARAAELHPGVRVIRIGDRPSGPSEARNRACKLATTPIVVFVDADVRVHPCTLGTLLAPFECDERVVAVFGSYDDDPVAGGVPALYGNLRHHTVHQASPDQAETFWSGLGAVRRDVFVTAGGFDTSFGEPSIEDVELGTRLREHGRIRVVHGAQATHLKRWTMWGLWQTDVFKRAVPWGQLAASRPSLGLALNGAGKERVSAGLVALAVAGAAAIPFTPTGQVRWLAIIGFALAVGLWCAANRRLLGKLHTRGGVRALLGGGLLHAVYYVYAPGAYLLSLAWHRWVLALSSRTPSLPVVALLAAATMATAAGGLGAAVLGLVGTEYLHAKVTGLQGEGSMPRYNLPSLAAAQDRLLLIGVLVFGVATAGAIGGPKRLESLLRSARHRFCEVFLMSRGCWIGGGLVSIAYLTLGLMHINQQMRLDEAASYSMFAGGSPMVALATYDTPNNHMLHSILMWISVQLLGPAEWSARLPAFLAAQCIPICMIAFATRLLRPAIGIVGAALLVGSPIGIDIATNARGYP